MTYVSSYKYRIIRSLATGSDRYWASLVVQMVKNPPVMQETGWIPGLGRSPGGRHGNLLQYSGLENPMDRGAWQATVHGVAESGTWLSD